MDNIIKCDMCTATLLNNFVEYNDKPYCFGCYSALLDNADDHDVMSDTDRELFNDEYIDDIVDVFDVVDKKQNISSTCHDEKYDATFRGTTNNARQIDDIALISDLFSSPSKDLDDPVKILDSIMPVRDIADLVDSYECKTQSHNSDTNIDYLDIGVIDYSTTSIPEIVADPLDIIKSKADIDNMDIDYGNIFLQNVSNNCYVNSIMQIFLHDRRLLNELYETFGFRKDMRKYLRETFIANNIYKIGDDEHEDCIYFFRFLLDKITEIHNPRINMLYSIEINTNWKCGSCGDEFHKRNFINEPYTVHINAKSEKLDVAIVDSLFETITKKCANCGVADAEFTLTKSLDYLPPNLFLSMLYFN